jgi:anthranilate synthase component II
MRIGIVDNYDSFTYNLVHYLEEITGEKPSVFLNDAIDWLVLDECTHLILSPGPGLPGQSGNLMKVIETYYLSKNILGVCLGMQAIAEFFGGQLTNLSEVQHGVQTKVFVEFFEGNQLYKNLPQTIEVGRYHSWVVDENNLPKDLLITAKDEVGSLMSIQHQSLPIYGVQYHPESIMTLDGKQILKNWLGI